MLLCVQGEKEKNSREQYEKTALHVRRDKENVNLQIRALPIRYSILITLCYESGVDISALPLVYEMIMYVITNKRNKMTQL